MPPTSGGVHQQALGVPARGRRLDVSALGMLLGFMIVTLLVTLALGLIYDLLQRMGTSIERFQELSKRVVIVGERNIPEKEILKHYVKEELKKEEAKMFELEAELAKLNLGLAEAEAESKTQSIAVNGTVLYCEYGSGTVLVPRTTRNGTKITYWKEMLDGMPSSHVVQMVAVLNKLGEPAVHPRVSHVIDVAPGDPPDFDEQVIMRPLKQNFNDSLTRVKWRSNIMLDFIRIMRFVTDRCRYALWIEDDTILRQNWFNNVKLSLNRFLRDDNNDWTHHFIGRGMPGVIINSYYAHEMLQYMTHRFDEEPVDWAIQNFNEYKRRTNTKIALPLEYAIIGHRGQVSSLTEADERPVF